MNVGNFPIHQPTHQNVRRSTNHSREPEYVLTLWMRPPTAPDRGTCNHLSKTRNTGTGRLDSYSAFLHPSYDLFCLHDDSGRTKPLNDRAERALLTWTVDRATRVRATPMVEQRSAVALAPCRRHGHGFWSCAFHSVTCEGGQSMLRLPISCH